MLLASQVWQSALSASPEDKSCSMSVAEQAGGKSNVPPVRTIASMVPKAPEVERSLSTAAHTGGSGGDGCAGGSGCTGGSLGDGCAGCGSLGELGRGNSDDTAGLEPVAAVAVSPLLKTTEVILVMIAATARLESRAKRGLVIAAMVAQAMASVA
eukprot:6187750-Pleurochrysis_carterae.AAC.1